MLFLFDIDGTLLTTAGTGFEASLEAFERIAGRRISVAGRLFAGSLDPIIWRELCQTAGVAESLRQDGHAAFRELYTELLIDRLRAPGVARALPGTHELVAALRQRPETTLGLLTGNYPETGQHKIQAAGFEPAHFSICAWGTDGATRRDLPPVAMARYRENVRPALAAHEVVILGDTPHDIDCARHNGCRSIGVATGRYQRAELEAAGADIVFENLASTQNVLDWLAG